MKTYPVRTRANWQHSAIAAQSADSDWRVWRIVHSPRWRQSATGPDYLQHQGTCVAIVPVGDGYTFELNGRRSGEVFPTVVEAKEAAAMMILASPRRDKERIAAARLRDEQARKEQ